MSNLNEIKARYADMSKYDLMARNEANQFIENAIADIPAILSALEAVVAENAKLREACDVGMLLSNMAYNLVQDERINETTRADLNRLRVAWDEANRQLSESIYRWAKVVTLYN